MLRTDADVPLIHLIRHAPPAIRGVFHGSHDVPLASEVLPPSALDAASVFASPLQRARRTAEMLFPEHEIRILPELAECSFGEWEGKPWEAIQERWPELASRKMSDWRGITPPAGEPWDEFCKRVEKAWTIIRNAPPPIVVVAHGGVNSVLARLIAGRDPFTFQQDYCEVLTFAIAG
jgi:broad specificity phosphatase PhoE